MKKRKDGEYYDNDIRETHTEQKCLPEPWGHTHPGHLCNK